MFRMMLWWSSSLLLLLTVLQWLPQPCQAITGTTVSMLSSKSKKNPFHSQKRAAASLLLSVRGGQSQNNNNGGDDDPYSTSYTNFEANSAMTPDPYEGGFANYNNPAQQQPQPQDADHIFHETVQDRVDKWRSAQLEKSQHLSPLQQASPRDESGRMKLLASVGKGSRAFIFFVLMWRDIHLFELADKSFKGATRLMVVVPLTLLFLGNLMGVIASMTGALPSSKKKLKAILNFDKFVESILLGWYFIRLTVAPSKYVPREIFISNTLHSIFFLIQCQAYTRVTW